VRFEQNKLFSPHDFGVETQPKVALQFEKAVQLLGSTHKASLGVLTQPIAGSHESSVQNNPSSQLIAIVPQDPVTGSQPVELKHLSSGAPQVVTVVVHPPDDSIQRVVEQASGSAGQVTGVESQTPVFGLQAKVEQLVLAGQVLLADVTQCVPLQEFVTHKLFPWAHCGTE